MDGWEETEGQVLKLREPEGAGGRKRRMGGWMDRWMDESKDGWMGRRIERRKDGRKSE